ncbi:MAG: cytochrome d ubiquinol oxidase subunit II [Microbacteriaceae bacterium]
MDTLPTLWFIAVALLWTGYLLLEGFDLGVGMHMLISARTDRRRRLLLNTIGPVWDGNEVWLITAGAATFAAFPLWYASLFSTLYLPLTIVVLALIFRAVGIEWRGKGKTVRWTGAWDRAIGIGSFVAAFGVGAMLALTTLGLPINENGDRVGGPFAWFGWEAVLGGLAVVGFSLVHGAVFLSLKTDGDARVEARRFVLRWMPLGLAPMAIWAVILVVRADVVERPVGAILAVVAVLGAVTSWVFLKVGREGRAFLGLAVFVVAGAAAIFASAYPVVIPSTLDAAFSLTVSNASSGDYTLGVMTVVAGFGLPLVVLYQGWTYWVFRRRLREEHIPDAHPVRPAVRS